MSPVGVRDEKPQFTNYLDNNYPNPFNPVTSIRYGITDRAHVTLRVYDVRGRLVRTLVDEVQNPDANHRVEWNGRNNAGNPVASGVYFYKLNAKNFTKTRKMVLLR